MKHITLNDLIPGMHILVCEDGQEFLVCQVGTNLLGMSMGARKQFIQLRAYYNEDLSLKVKGKMLDWMQINEVCKFNPNGLRTKTFSYLRTTVWKRPVPKVISIDELEKLYGAPVVITGKKNEVLYSCQFN